jgi:hypothetical protein
MAIDLSELNIVEVDPGASTRNGASNPTSHDSRNSANTKDDNNHTSSSVEPNEVPSSASHSAHNHGSNKTGKDDATNQQFSWIGKPRPFTFKELHNEWSQTVALLRQHSMAQKQEFKEAKTVLEKLFTVVEGCFREGTAVAGLIFGAMEKAARSRCLQISLNCFPVFLDPLWCGQNAGWSNCRLTCMLVALFGSPTNLNSLNNALDFFGGPRHRKRIFYEVLEGSGSLAQALLQARKVVLKGGNDAITIIGVELLDCDWEYYPQRYPREGDGLISFAHSFIMAVGVEGVRIFQSFRADMDMPGYTLPEYIERGSARLRNWEEIAAFVANFKVLSQPAVS